MQELRKHTCCLVAATLAVSILGNGCLGRKHKQAADTGSSAEPDKLLYNRAMDDYKHGRYTVERLALQTLINTYPDSEYLAKAKLAIADSYFKEGGTSGLTQSIAEYKDFITFFPFLDEAAYAQMQVAMGHYRMMEKPDRDRTQAQLAEDEFQTFLLKYAQNPLTPQAEQRLREVQEILAEGDYRVARFYYIKGSDRAAAARLVELADRYPLYSQADKALWMLGNLYERNEHRDLAEKYYARIVRDYPLSSSVDDAKRKLAEAGVAVPQPDPVALARMRYEQEFARHGPSLLRRSLGMLKTGPDVTIAAHTGQPNLNPAGETPAASEILKRGTAPTGSLGESSASSGTGATNSVAVETVPAGSSPSAAPGNGNPPATGNAESPSASSAAAGGKPPAADAVVPATKSAKPPDPNKKKDGESRSKKESSSKKKKGLRKIIPW